MNGEPQQKSGMWLKCEVLMAGKLLKAPHPTISELAAFRNMAFFFYVQIQMHSSV
jgi:hypothetical protein